MKKFKVVFPSGYVLKSYDNDNIDLNIYTEDGIVYAATAFTLENIKFLLNKDRNEYGYFWASDMFIVENLRLETLLNAVKEIFEKGYENLIFSSIGTVNNVYEKSSYDDVIGHEGAW